MSELIKGAGTTTYVLGILYLCATVYALSRFFVLLRGRVNALVDLSWETPKIFVASVAFGCFVRTLSFVTVTILAIANVSLAGDPADSASGPMGLYDRVLAVLFNTGDWAAVSTYLLLIVVWVEMLQR